MRIGSILENLKLWIYLHKSDIKAIFKMSIPIILLFFFILKIPAMIRNYSLSKFDSEIIGVVDSIEKKEGIQESEIGGNIIVKTYRIYYHYEVENKKITCSEIIDKNSITIKQRNKLNKIEEGDSILVRYSSQNLKRSKIKITSKNR